MRAMFKPHRNLLHFAFSPDGRSLVSGFDGCSVFNIRDGSPKELTVTDHACYFLSVVFSPDGKYIAAGDWRCSLWIWDSRTHKVVANWRGHSDPVRLVEFTPDGKGLMSGSMDRTVKYWDVSSLGIYGAAPGRRVVNPEHLFPLIRTFSVHNVRLYLFCRIQFVETSTPIERLLRYCILPRQQ